MKFIILCFAIIVFSCSSTKLFSPDMRSRVSFRSLSTENNTALRNYLQQYSSAPLKDTLMIKYNFNNETCWNELDQHGDNFIFNMITHYHHIIDSFAVSKPHSSVFEFRQPGNNTTGVDGFPNPGQLEAISNGFGCG